MTAYINEFSTYLVETKAVSSNTLESYKRDVKQYIDYLCAEEDIDGSERVINSTVEDVSEFIEHLRESGKSTATITRMLASVRSYYQFLMINGVVDSNPAKQIKVERAVKKIPNILSDTEVIRLLNAPNPADLKGARDKAMLELLYATGIRVSELINLNISDVKCEKGTRGEVHCVGAKTQRSIPMHMEATNALHYYLTSIRPLLVTPDSDDALFINLNGSRLSRQGFWKIVKNYAEIANISGEITPHTLRHSFAMHLYQNGASLHDLQLMLGHADISSTQLYANMSQMSKCQDVYDRCHPLSAKQTS